MPKLIVTSRYLKSGSRKNLANYVKYIATREGVVPSEIKNPNAPVSLSQQELISSMLNDFPDSKDLHEYEDYQKNPTIKNGSALISEILDRNMDRLTNRENYVGYLANRPGAMKFGSHGLFNAQDNLINLERIAKEIANHGGNVWTHVVSLRRDNAQQMGYDNLKSWRDLVIRQIPNIAKNQKINLLNLRWYAAFHDKKTNPHVHILVYSTNEREGFLTNQGIQKIRSGFANDIYQDELHHLYSQQTQLRDLLKLESKKFMEQLAAKISSENFSNAELNELIRKLHSHLNNTRGRKVYGYLPPNVKETVDDIFSRLSENKSIQKMYDLWCEMEQQKHDVYSSAKVKFSKLADNREFKSVKNMIINQVLNMGCIVDISVADEPEPVEYASSDDSFVKVEIPNEIAEPMSYDESAEQDNYFRIEWSDEYKSACSLMYSSNAKAFEREFHFAVNDRNFAKQNRETSHKDQFIDKIREAERILLAESEKGNLLATHDLGKLHSMDKFDFKDENKEFNFYKQALSGFMEIEPSAKKLKQYIQYRIGKFHCYGLGTEQNYEKAFVWFHKASQPMGENLGNKFAQYSLANLYYYGNGVEKNLEQAFLWYKTSASQGQPYAAYAVAQFYIKGIIVEKNEDIAHEHFKKALTGFLKLAQDEQADDNLFYKIATMYKNGLGTEIDMVKAIEYFKQSAELANKHGLYEYSKALLVGEHVEQDISQALECLEKAISFEHINAKRFLALEYISGEYLEKDIEKGIAMLTECGDSGDAFSAYRLRKIYFNGKVVSKNVNLAEKYLLIGASDENQFAQYQLRKMYLIEEKYDLDKGVEWLEMAVKQDNVFAKYQLAKILIAEKQYRDIPRAAELLESIAEENNLASYQLGKLYLFGAEDFPKDKDLAIEWFTKSSEQCNIYAQNLLSHMDDFENAMISNAIFGLFMNLSRCISEDYNDRFKANRISMDHKLRRVIQQKKLALGMKDEQSNQLEQSY